MAQQIIVNIADGKAQIETRGFEGAACYDATKELEKAMGAVQSDSKTPEFHTKHQQVQGH